MKLRGELIAESPIYRGNARKTLFTRDGNGMQRLVSLAGEIGGTAQSLMDAFIGHSKNGRNTGLLNQLWQRLYGAAMPEQLIRNVSCRLQEKCYSSDHFFDLRMGIKLDEDRWAAEANANYKVETLFKNAIFDIMFDINDTVLQAGDHLAKLYYMLQELREGRFWFGGAKSKGLGRCRLEMDFPFSPPDRMPKIRNKANHLTLEIAFKTENPVLIGWNWGRLDPNVPAFAVIEGRFLIKGMRQVPPVIRERLELAIGGPILSPDDWKNKFAEFFPKIIAIWLQEQAKQSIDVWVFPKVAIAKFGKGKYALAKKVLQNIEAIADQPFENQQEAEAALLQALGKKANMAKRIMGVLQHQTKTAEKFSEQAWNELVEGLGFDASLGTELAQRISDESALLKILSPACQKVMPSLYQHVDRQMRLLQSDPWIEEEIANREEHIKIKTLILQGKIDERQWRHRDILPEGVSAKAWQEFLETHERVAFAHIKNSMNLQKSITNDQNQIAFLKAYRERTRQELSQPYNTDFRAGGASNREISQKYGKAYDTVFMRMLAWAPTHREGKWEIYIPGSTLKGAFRKRATQLLKTLWGENSKTNALLNRLFGTQGSRGLVFFSDAYLKDSDATEDVWSSMDSVRMNPKTAEPIEEAKADYLFAYGDRLEFQFRIDAQDLAEGDMEAYTLLTHLLRDFQRGDIPLGGEKTNGFGWVQGKIREVNWLTAKDGNMTEKLFGQQDLQQQGIWQQLSFAQNEAENILKSASPILPALESIPTAVPRAPLGFVSHRLFGGFCGILEVEGNVLTPLSIKESGEPSFRAMIEDEPVNGWDFYSLSSPRASLRGESRVYAIPSKSLRGMLRHIYAIVTKSEGVSSNLGDLHPADSLFGWVGAGPNQAIAARVSFHFAPFENPQLSWYKVPFPYGNWQFENGEWQAVQKARVKPVRISDEWRLFPHAPLAPGVEKLGEFKPDSVQATYMRAILPGAKCKFRLRFWNLEKEELQRLLWCIVLEDGLAHKMGKGRYLGFGSLRFHLLNTSYLIDWSKRYDSNAAKTWKQPIELQEWIVPDLINHYEELKQVLDAKYI